MIEKISYALREPYIETAHSASVYFSGTQAPRATAAKAEIRFLYSIVNMIVINIKRGIG